MNCGDVLQAFSMIALSFPGLYVKKRPWDCLHSQVKSDVSEIAVVTVVYLNDILPMLREQVNETSGWKPHQFFSTFPHSLLFKLGRFVSVPYFECWVSVSEEETASLLIVAITLWRQHVTKRTYVSSCSMFKPFHHNRNYGNELYVHSSLWSCEQSTQLRSTAGVGNSFLQHYFKTVIELLCRWVWN